MMNSMIAGAVSDSIIKLLNHTNDLVRKKAVLVLQKIVFICLFRNKFKEIN